MRIPMCLRYVQYGRCARNQIFEVSDSDCVSSGMEQRHWNSTGHPDNHGVGMTLHEYAAHLALWSVFGSPLIHSAGVARPACPPPRPHGGPT